MTLFRCSLPELCNYFEDEEVDIHEWSTSWLQNLLSKEMRFDNLVRLWGNEKKKEEIIKYHGDYSYVYFMFLLIDCYFAMSDPFAFHPFVCLCKFVS